MNKRINYLSNRELLAEIHKSKLTFCYFVDETASNYDLILQSVDLITPEAMLKARQNRLDRLLYGQKDLPLTIDDISEDDIVIRIMTYEHIPALEKEKVSKRLADNYERVNFKPFKHYRIVDGEPVEVGRSHWRDGLHNGSFSTEHGKITNRLARQFVLLVDRYSQKSNWRNYTYLEDMKGQAIVQLVDSALKFDEAVSDNPFSYMTMCVLNSFRGILNNEKRVGDIRNKLMQESGYDASFGKQAEQDVD